MTNLAALPSGTELVNDYKIDKVLGAGGFGITYLAHEIALDRRVTIKEYFPTDYAARNGDLEAAPRSQDCASDYRWGLDRFIEEAQTLAKFNHPHIVRVYRYFRANNTGYMVLHFEEGQSFKNWLKGLGRAARQKELDTITEPLLEALDLIHKQDFLHRDIAPDNIIIRKDGSPVLIDFGSARASIAAQSKTVSALVKPGYSPYEQYAETSRQQGPWTDIYALGATLYHAATGKRPPDAPSRMVNDEYRTARDAAISAYRPRFLRAIDKSLVLNVEERPQSIGEWRGELLAPDTIETKPAKKPAKTGWLTRRRKKAELEHDDTPDILGHSEVKPLAPDDAADLGNTVPLPPPPDAPGPKGGIVNFVDGLKRRARPEPLAAALARVGKPDSDLGNIGQPGADAQPAPDSDASHDAHTQKHDPRSDRKRRARVPRSAARDQAEVSAPNSTPSHSHDNQTHHAQNALAVQKAERRRPARPRPMPSRSGSGWKPFLTKVIAGAGIAGILIASRDSLPQIDVAALIESARSSITTPATVGATRRNTRETAAISRREPAKSTKRTVAKRPAPKPKANPLLRQTAAHERPATAMVYSADGKTLVTASKDQTLKIWNAGSGALKRTIQLGPAPATALAIQTHTIAAGHEDGLIEIFDLDTGIKTASMRRNEASIWSLAFTNQPGRLAAASHDWKIALWDVSRPHAPIHILEGHENSVQALASAPGSPYLATGGADRRVKLWNLDTFELVRTYPKQRDFVTALAFSPDGSRFASATLNGDIRIWSTRNRRLLKRLRGHKGAVEDLSYSPDGQLLTSGGSDGTIRIWNVKRGRTIKTMASHAGAVNAVGFSPDGQAIASIGDDGRLRMWSTDSTRTGR